MTRPSASASSSARRMSFAISSMRKPKSKRRVSTGPAAKRSVVKLRPEEALTTRTISSGSSPAFAPITSASHVAALDAPVSGGVAGAEAGTLSVMAAGDPAAFERVRPVLEAIGSNTVFVGEAVGQGQTLKLVNNLLAATTWAAACEAMAMGVKAGLDPELMVRVLNASSGRSFPTERFAAGPVLSRRFDFGFRMELMAKDMRLALEEAEALGLVMPTCGAARLLYGLAMAQGAADADVTELVRVTEGWAGVEVAARGRNEA